MADQHDEAARPVYFLAQLETLDDRDRLSLHLAAQDAEQQLKAVADAGVLSSRLMVNRRTGFVAMESRK